MTVPIAEVGRRGRLDIAFALRNGRTVIRQSYCEVPFKITRLHGTISPGSGHLILMHCTAGLFGGDDLRCNIQVDSGARVVLTQQSATKVHPSGNAPVAPATQATHIRVESGAELVVDFEPVIPFAGSRLDQRTRIEVEPGARLVFWESFMAGRIGKEEVWKFEELSSETRLEMTGRPLYLDRFSLKPARQDATTDWIVKGAGYVGTGICFGDGATRLAGRLHDAFPEAGVDAVSSNLVVFRTVATSGPDALRYRQGFRAASSDSRESPTESYDCTKNMAGRDL